MTEGSSYVSVLTPDALRAATTNTVSSMVSSRSMVLAIGDGEISGDALAVGLFADFFALDDNAVLAIDVQPRVVAALAARIGRGAFRLLLDGTRKMPAGEAKTHGLVDAIVPVGTDAREWANAWLARRSALALNAGASLIRRRGGDRLERAAFAWLFATGEPQEGLAAFLEKRAPQFGRDVR
jgi:enoyl-CoA hydratase/carnithine racemase